MNDDKINIEVSLTKDNKVLLKVSISVNDDERLTAARVFKSADKKQYLLMDIIDLFNISIPKEIYNKLELDIDDVMNKKIDERTPLNKDETNFHSSL